MCKEVRWSQEYNNDDNNNISKMWQHCIFMWFICTENNNLQSLLHLVFSTSFIFFSTDWSLYSLKTSPRYSTTLQRTQCCSQENVWQWTPHSFSVSITLPVVDNYPAEVSWPHLPVLSLRHQRNGVHPRRALPVRQREAGGWGGWGWRGGRPWGHWTDSKRNGCPEEGVCVLIHFCMWSFV